MERVFCVGGGKESRVSLWSFQITGINPLSDSWVLLTKFDPPFSHPSLADSYIWKQKVGGRFTPSQYGMCCRCIYLLSLLQISPKIPINSDMTAKSLRPHFPCTGGPGLMRLTLTFRTRPFWWDVHPRSPYTWRMEPGLQAPHGPRRPPACVTLTILAGPLSSRGSGGVRGASTLVLVTSENGGWEQEERWREHCPRTGGARRLCSPPLLGHWSYPAQILHLLGNQYAPGVFSFRPPRKHNGGGAA